MGGDTQSLDMIQFIKKAFGYVDFIAFRHPGIVKIVLPEGWKVAAGIFRKVKFNNVIDGLLP